jgi:hypothetical protein
LNGIEVQVDLQLRLMLIGSVKTLGEQQAMVIIVRAQPGLTEVIDRATNRSSPP